MLALKLESDTNGTRSYALLEDGTKVGETQLRATARKSDAMPAGFESHVYYEIDEAYRGRGLGHEILRLLLAEASALGHKQLVLTVADHNVSSIKIIERAGGVLRDTKPDANGTLYRKYDIGSHPSEPR